MFVITNINKNPLTGNTAFWFYSPRCSLSCKNCLLPIKTLTRYNKLDVVEEFRPFRKDVDDVVFYIGDLKQKYYIVSRYINVIKSRWRGVGIYLAFSFPQIPNLWRLINYRLIDGFIFYLHWTLAVPKTGEPQIIKMSGCSFKEYLHAVFLLEAIKQSSIEINYCICPLYDRNRLTKKYELSWDTYLRTNFSVCC